MSSHTTLRSPQCPAPSFLGGESGTRRPRLSLCPFFLRATHPVHSEVLAQQLSQPNAGSWRSQKHKTWLLVATTPPPRQQNWILSFSALDLPVWSKRIPACSKNRIFETKIPACFYISLLQMVSTMPGAPSSLRRPSQCDRDGLVPCACGLQPRKELQKQLGCPLSG